MVQTVLAPAPLTARLVRPQTAYVAVMLVGRGQTVAVVIFITNDNDLSNFAFETIKKTRSSFLKYYKVNISLFFRIQKLESSRR